LFEEGDAFFQTARWVTSCWAFRTSFGINGDKRMRPWKNRSKTI